MQSQVIPRFIHVCGKRVYVSPIIEKMNSIFNENGPADPAIHEWDYGVPWYPTPLEKIPWIIENFHIRSNTSYCELGVGDCRIPYFIAKTADKSVSLAGFEIRKSMMKYATNLLKQEGLQNRISVIQKNVFQDGLSKMKDADYVYFYMYDGKDESIAGRIGKILKPGTIVINKGWPIELWKEKLVSQFVDFYKYII